MGSTGTSGGGTAGYPYPTTENTLRPAQPEDVDHKFVIAVLDTGVTLDGPRKEAHSFIAPNLTRDSADHPDEKEEFRRHRPDYPYGKKPVDVTTGPLDGHGTFVAGVILQEAPFATIAMRSPLDSPTPPPVLDNQTAVANAIRGLIGMDNLKLVNLGGYNVLAAAEAPAEIGKALGELFGHPKHSDVLVVTSLANNWSGETVWPAGFNATYPKNIIAVGAVDETPTPYAGVWRPPPRASFANWGGVDVWANGVSVLGPHLQPPATLVSYEDATGWARWSGTPFATAAVTGKIARLMKYWHEPLTGREAFDRLIALRPTIEVPGLDKKDWKPWLRVRGSRWPEFPGV